MKERSRGKGAQQTRVNRWASGPADAGGALGAVRGGGVSESVAKAPRAGIGGEKKRGISTILFRHPGSIRAFATDLDNSTPRAPARMTASAITPASGPARPAPGRRDVHFALERALLTAHLEGEMHLSRAKCTSRRAQDRSAPPPRTASARTAPRRPGPRTTTPGEKAQWDGVSHVVTRPICLDHLRSVGPPGSRNTVVQPHTSGPSRRAPLRSRRRPRAPHPHHRPLNNLPDQRGPSPRAARTIRASRASISSSRPMRARGDFSEPGVYGWGVRIQRGLFAFAGAIGAQRQGCTDPARPACHRLQRRRTIPTRPAGARRPGVRLHLVGAESLAGRRCPISRGAPLPP